MRELNKLQVLVAEDNADDVKAIKQALASDHLPGSFGFVRDGQEVIDYLQGKGFYNDRSLYPFPDVLVLDLKIPQFSGFETLRWVRKHSDWAQLPVLVLSDSSLPAVVEEAYRLGANSFFSKPMRLDALTELLRGLISYWTLSRRPSSQQPDL